MAESMQQGGAQLGGIYIPVREFNVQEIRTWFESMGARKAESVDVIGDLVADGLSLWEMQYLFPEMAGVDLGKVYPSELAELVAVFKERNPEFARIRKALDEMGQRINAEIPNLRDEIDRQIDAMQREAA